MKKRINDLTTDEITKICLSHKCITCPLTYKSNVDSHDCIATLLLKEVEVEENGDNYPNSGDDES